MIPAPKLDDREFKDIVAEALRLIPRYAPEWTHHNPADPGITLIELAAWMTDIILYRLNKVPEKNYIAFLNLLGIKLKPPLASRGVLQFSLVAGATRQRIPAGTQVTTPQTDDDAVVYETARDLIVTNVPVDRCFSYYDETYSDNSRQLEVPLEGGYEVFGGGARVERFLYLSDPRFSQAGESSVLRLFLGCPEHGGRDLARLLEWEFWNGDRWRELSAAPLEVDRGEVCFFGPLAFEPTTVNDIEGLWIRGRIGEVLEEKATEIDTIRARVEVSGEGLPPERAVLNLDTDAFIFLDLGKNVYPLGKEPKVDCVLYMSCEALLSTADAEIAIEMVLAESTVIPAPQASEDLTLAWEYFDGKRWRPLGRSGPQGVRPGAADFFFSDGTKGFTETGTVSFRRPVDMEPVEIAGEEARWIRVRVESGDFGLAGNYTLDADKWVFKDDRPLRPPAFRLINFRYREDYKDLRHVLTLNDFQFADVTEEARSDYTIFQPFIPQTDDSPTIYLGWDGLLPNENHTVYFEMAEDLGPGSLPAEESAVVTTELEKYEEQRLAAWEAEQRVVWEFYNGKLWETLPVVDGTSGFTASGFVEFVAPDNWSSTLKFTEERHWLRARLEMGGYTVAPRVLKILPNSVLAHNYTTIREEIIGSSDATPLQSFELLHRPLLSGEAIWIRERQQPSDEELIDIEGLEAVRHIETAPGEDPTEEVWVNWRRVESFFESGPLGRHYVLEYETGEIGFGDGRKGMIPPEGLNNIVSEFYRVGGGSRGNVNAGSITSLSRAIAYIDAVTNPIAAAGGADRETVEEAKDRAPYTIKSRDRAVTGEDFEMLALRSSTTLARAKCVPDRRLRGAIRLVLVPKADTEARESGRRLVPSSEMLRYVKRYLDERRLVGTILNVEKPRYQDVSLKVVLLRRTIGTSDRLRDDIEHSLRRFLHPLTGGRDGVGWPFGRAVLKTDLIHLVEEVQGVEGVDSIEMSDEERQISVEQLRLADDELPHLVHVRIVERVRDEIM